MLSAKNFVVSMIPTPASTCSACSLTERFSTSKFVGILGYVLIVSPAGLGYTFESGAGIITFNFSDNLSTQVTLVPSILTQLPRLSQSFGESDVPFQTITSTSLPPNC